MHTNFRDVKLWEDVHLKIDEIQYDVCSACHMEMVKGSVAQQMRRREVMGSILKHHCLRKGNDTMVPDQLIKLALLGFIISLLMLLPRAPITIYAQNDCYKAQLRGKNS